MDRLSILMFTHADVRAGAEEYMLMLAKGLDQRYFRAHIACPHALAERLRPDVPGHVELIPTELTEPWQARSLMRLGAVLRKRRIDILHSHMFFSSLLATPVGWCCRTPLIIEGAHGREAWRRGWKDRYYVDRFIGRMVDAYIAVSDANARYLVEVKRYPAEKISVIHPASDVASFDPGRIPPAGLRESIGIGPTDPILLVMGRLEPQKGHRVLLDVMPAVRSQFPTVRIVCAGDGVLRQTLEAQSRALGLEDTVRFVGYRSDIRDWLAAAEFTVLPSFWEGLPIAPIESLAAGRTVVATAVDGTPDIVVHGKTGLTVPPDDPAALSKAICTMLRDADLRHRLAACGRQWAVDHFSVETLVRKTERLYWHLWERRARTSTDRKKSLIPEHAPPPKPYGGLR